MGVLFAFFTAFSPDIRDGFSILRRACRRGCFLAACPPHVLRRITTIDRWPARFGKFFQDMINVVFGND